MIDRSKIPYRDIPVLPLRNALLFPGQTIPVVVGRQRSLAAVDAALAGDRWILIVAQKDDASNPTLEDLHRVGVIARIENRIASDEGQSCQLVLSGYIRFQASSISEKGNYLVAEGAPLEDILDLEGEMAHSLMKNLKVLAKEIFSYFQPSMAQLGTFIEAINDPVQLTHLAAQHLELKISRKQQILEMLSVKNRFLTLLEIMVKVRDDLKIQREVSPKVSGKLGNQQREAILREQIRALQEELGEGRSDLSKDYLEKIEQSGMSEEAKKVALEQLARLESMSNGSPELHVIRNYLDLLVALPWRDQESEEIDLDKARAILDRDHFGLEKIKTRILQHLAVMKLKKDKKGSILLFVGPPGVGKTSLARSIAESLGREYARISLGGVRDDAEIRGHRRTYVGALPGRIIDGIKRVGQNNPVFVLDEIDKMNRGWGGDPASAMLEVLDPEQNVHFMDHYLDVPFDLSRVFFVATANSLETIPGPLLDRMEIIPVSGYTTLEKLHIARKHLFPKQLTEHGLTDDRLKLSDEVLLKVIGSYTREAGVRDLQRQIAALIRFAAEKIVTQPVDQPFVLTLASVEEALGSEKFMLEVAERSAVAGVATGMAWTPMGGDILFVESRAMPGKGQLLITGQLGDVMKESAQIAFSHVRSRIQPYAATLRMDQTDFHLHVPSGAIPKDGPSAGVTILAAMTSLVLNKPVPTDLAMTGEITLRGAVMPVGGIKEKVIAAHRAGICRVLLPKRNERDLKEVPEEVRSQINFEFIENVDALFQVIFGFTIPEVSGTAVRLSVN